LENAEDVKLLLDIYIRHREVIGLNIKVNKSTTLCVNTSPEILPGL
jgi:hypothetical protein